MPVKSKQTKILTALCFFIFTFLNDEQISQEHQMVSLLKINSHSYNAGALFLSHFNTDTEVLFFLFGSLNLESYTVCANLELIYLDFFFPLKTFWRRLFSSQFV